MSNFHKLFVVPALASNLALAGPGLDDAEVRLPYGELKTLIAAAHPVTNPEPVSALLSARFRLTIADARPVVDATFRTTTFSDGFAVIPLVGGDLTVGSQKPPDARVLIRNGKLCEAIDKAGTQALEMRLLPSSEGDAVSLSVPPCPAAVLETGDLGAERSVAVKIAGREQVLGSDDLVALPLAGGSLEIRMLGGEETREALRPPEPSEWTWQHQARVIPDDGEIDYRVVARASAAGGSGVAAVLILPPDARQFKVTGDDIATQKIVRGADRSMTLQIEWKTRGQLERELAISYLLPRRHLDRTWKLQAPAGPGANATRTRFIVSASPELSYAADGLAGPFAPKGLPALLEKESDGSPWYQLEATATADLTVNPLPVVATADAAVNDAIWLAKLEPDGAMLVEGAMNLEHRGMVGVILDVPPGMSLLSCDVGGAAATPLNLGGGKLEISLPAAGGKTRVSCSFTGRNTAFDPVQGTLELLLPKTPLFVRALTWKIDLPRGYQAETHGNLVRAAEPGDPPSRLTLRKNLCRDEWPSANVFYQRADLKNP